MALSNTGTTSTIQTCFVYQLQRIFTNSSKKSMVQVQKVKKKKSVLSSPIPLNWSTANEDHEYTPSLNRWENQASVNILSHPLK